MSTTQPIRNKESLKKFKDYYRIQKPNQRNYTLIIFGLNTALRISDILNLTYDKVYDGKNVRKDITIKEQKTRKENCISLNSSIRNALKSYRNYLINSSSYKCGNPYLFPSPYLDNRPLSRYQAYRLIREAAQAIDLAEHISCHSLRKTFGYYAWKQGYDPLTIMFIYNHSSFDITKRYLCIEQDDKDRIFQNIII